MLTEKCAFNPPRGENVHHVMFFSLNEHFVLLQTGETTLHKSKARLRNNHFGNEGVLVRRVAAATQEYDGRTNVRTHHNIKHVF